MRKDQPSFTAAGIALARAIESTKPAGERVCYDPFARHFIGRLFFYFLRLFVDIGYSEKRGPGVMGFLVARDRYIDDYLQSCLDDGLEQLVILGAGYDSRAYRFEKLKGQVKVFEVDHPATQQAKKEKLRKILGELPEHVVYVPVDFATETLEKRLYESGYDKRLKTLFIWQGVTYYLTPEAVDSTLAFVANHSGQGSSIIFDYMDTSLLNGTIKRGEVSGMRRYRRFTGEGLTFGIDEGTIEKFLHQRGFCQIKNVTTGCLKKAYFTGVNQKREVAPGYAIVAATVKFREDE
jgi:methyltransferase (TIGR00027 family)